MTAPAPQSFGTLPDGREVTAHTLATPGGLSLRVLDLGAAVQALHLPGPAGGPASGMWQNSGPLRVHPRALAAPRLCPSRGGPARRTDTLDDHISGPSRSVPMAVPKFKMSRARTRSR